MKEYTFGVSLGGEVRVKADSEKLARRALSSVIAYSEPTQEFLDGFNDESVTAIITHFSLSPDEGDGAVLVEIDGEAI